MFGNKRIKTWKTRDGRGAPINELEDCHLLNIVRMLQRYAENQRASVSRFYLHIVPPFDPDSMAAYYFDRDMDAAFQSDAEDYLPNIYYNLKSECERHHLLIPIFDPNLSLKYDNAIASELLKAKEKG